jgi:outer membrane lipoprotein carrier protein
MAAAASLLALVPGVICAAEPAVERLQRFFDEVTSMRADFVQTVGAEGFASVDESEGVFRLQRPGKFRWDYTEPYEQHIIADGKKLWVYDVDLDQVIVKDLAFVLGQTPAVLLSGPVDLTQQFDIRPMPEREQLGLTWIELKPKNKDTGFDTILLGFSEKNLNAMELMDSFGQVTYLRFFNLQRNPQLDPSIFEFKPPPGVDVIGETELLPAE